MKWQREKPEKEGWWFWRRSNTVKDQWKWRALYVMYAEPYKGKKPDVETIEEPQWEVWEAGTDMQWPKGGWWTRIPL